MQTEAEAFLQRIRAYPDDDTPRLIFADWLEEQGERMPGATDRARFIRVQVALARLEVEESADPYRPNPGRAERENTRLRLQAEAQALLDAHGAEWVAPIRPVASGPVFRRGFVEQVNVSARDFLRHQHPLFAAGPLRHLVLLDLGLGGNLTAVLPCAYLSRLGALTIHGSHIGEPLARMVAQASHLSGLRELHLSRNRFDEPQPLRGRRGRAPRQQPRPGESGGT
jgi:uncharacterized protein (TIGR02996 family)